jgi:hypothetical protein
MKKFYMTMVAMLCGVAAMAQTNELVVSDMTVPAGTKSVNLEVGLNNDSPVTAFQFNLALPEGVKAGGVKKFVLDRIDMDKVCYIMDDEDAEATDVYTIDRLASGNDFMYAIYPKPSRFQDDSGEWVAVTFTGNQGTVVTIPLTIDASALTEAGDGSFPISLYNIGISDDSEVAQSIGTASEAACVITVGEGTGINSINAADSKAPIYNVAGQRVSKAQKGVFIQNGKKVAVK